MSIHIVLTRLGHTMAPERAPRTSSSQTSKKGYRNSTKRRPTRSINGTAPMPSTPKPHSKADNLKASLLDEPCVPTLIQDSLHTSPSSPIFIVSAFLIIVSDFRSFSRSPRFLTLSHSLVSIATQSRLEEPHGGQEHAPTQTESAAAKQNTDTNNRE